MIWQEPSASVTFSDELPCDAILSVSSSFRGVIVVSCDNERRKSNPGVRGENVVVGATNPDCLITGSLRFLTRFNRRMENQSFLVDVFLQLLAYFLSSCLVVASHLEYPSLLLLKTHFPAPPNLEYLSTS